MQTKTKTNHLSHKLYVQLCSGIPYWSPISRTNFIDHKWAINMYKCLTVDKLDLCPLNLASTWSLTNIYLYMQFFMTVWNNFMMQHELGWIAIECHNCCMNLWILFSSLGKSQIILQWSMSILNLLDYTSTIVQSIFETIVNDHKTFPYT